MALRAGRRRRRAGRAIVGACRGRARSASDERLLVGACSGFSSSRGCSRSRCSRALGVVADRRQPGRLPLGGDPLAATAPERYTERFPNVQAAIGLEALKHLDAWTERGRAHAGDESRAGRSSRFRVPARADRIHARLLPVLPVTAEQYGDELVVRCVRRGIDIETLHVDVAPTWSCLPAPAPRLLARAARRRLSRCRSILSLTDEEIARVAAVVRDVIAAMR